MAYASTLLYDADYKPVTTQAAEDPGEKEDLGSRCTLDLEAGAWCLHLLAGVNFTVKFAHKTTTKNVRPPLGIATLHNALTVAPTAPLRSFSP